MAIEKINLNNQLLEPDGQGVVDLSTLLTTHQSLDQCVKTWNLQYVPADAWPTLSATADPGTFYFVGR